MPADPQRQFAIEIVNRLVEEGYEAYWAGGCVRDFLLGNKPKDYDVATNALPLDIRRIFGQRKTLAVGESFGVIVVLGPSKEAGMIEVATFRSDGNYLDGRRPESIEFCSAQEDAKRRDYTINGMFFDPRNNQVLDYVGGQEDLKAGRIRAIGNPVERMTEDKLRMLRAVRFTARFGFDLDEQTAQGIRRMASEIEVVSRERISQELRLILAHPNRMLAVQLLESLQLLFPIFPVLESLWKPKVAEVIHQMLLAQQSDSFELAMAILLSVVIENETNSETVLNQFCRDLKLSNSEIETIHWLLIHRHVLKDANRLPLHQLKPLLINPNCELLLEWMHIAAKVQNSKSTDVDFCREYLNKTSKETLAPPPLVTGQDLIQAGLKPGPDFANLLKRVRNAQLDEQIATREEGLTLIGLSEND
ncbi:CCA tRNA nucleotidyltransferase [Rubinisphaera italica]|uniref:tRNA nucleotidyltransferase/poly(A) polymerase n=1 Tax=Rubinisphaera italica TaxID=2527969 RepID=A0A5C5XEG4_9PLAN|nr:CCA tRNA nucleotidyltransferase [Rubinisphaera italica]TWT61188.1 tRNA nucleotidyltransferase/poly(A) polymerase [Rubinisphaera italica]